MSLQSTSVLVTGSTSGIGQSIAERFVAEGADVVVTGRDATRGRAVARWLDALGPGRCSFLAADLGTLDGPGRLAEAAEERLSGVDVLVNNAGIYKVDGAPLSAADFDEMMNLNVRGAHLLTTALLPRMAERGRGAVVNVTSPVAYRGYPGMAAYAATKGALDMLAKCWAAEFGKSGVRVNALSPGPVMTPGVEKLIGTGEEAPKDVLARTNLVAGRVATGNDISAAVLYLASPEAAYVNGSTLHVDGGMNGVGSLWGTNEDVP
ncbi:MAG TPA: SDR family oxidoreductase [Actinomycetota bacterium]|nr:SDR family oxidoreductase [Actinomycetota bacterium]